MCYGGAVIVAQPATSTLQRIADGDAAAVREGMERFGGLVWSLARRLLANPVDAEDAVQEIFIDLWRSADRFDPSAGSETAFVATIARRRLIDRHRRRGRRIETVPLDERLPHPASETANPVDARDEADRAREHLSRLRLDERRVIELSVYEGLSQSEIAAATDLPLGTVKTHARRGLARLRRLVGEDPPDTGD